MIDIIVASLAPVFLVIALGFVAGLTKDIDNRNIGSLNALVMDFALPRRCSPRWRRLPAMRWPSKPVWRLSCCLPC